MSWGTLAVNLGNCASKKQHPNFVGYTFKGVGIWSSEHDIWSSKHEVPYFESDRFSSTPKTILFASKKNTKIHN